jgi:short-subunit dehydrogenase
MPTIAIVGAGPGLGLALATRFGREGFDVALVARTEKNLTALVDELGSRGLSARGYAADVRDRESLAGALATAGAELGGIDVLEYSPLPGAELVLTSPSETTAASVSSELELQLFGAIAATGAVLPAMREKGRGTLLFTTGAGSIDPVPAVANVNAAAAALRNWAVNLHRELAGTGVHAAHVGIAVSIDRAVMPGSAVATASDIADAYYELYRLGTDDELVVRGDDGAPGPAA